MDWIRGHRPFAAKFSKIASKSLLLPGDINVQLNETGLSMGTVTWKFSLAPAAPEKLVFIYSNQKAVAAAARENGLKMFSWDYEDK